jgi:amino acid adenylation domain-containing protein
VNESPGSRLDQLSPERRAALARLLAQRGRTSEGASAAVAAVAAPTSAVGDWAARYEPFPLTEIQQAYWIGRSDAYALGGIASRAFFAIDCPAFDGDRFARSWAELVRRHDALRTVVDAEGMQRVLAEPPAYTLPELDLRGYAAHDVDAQLEAERGAMLAALEPPERWPLFDVRVARLDGGAARVLFAFDLLSVDGGSVALLLRELAQEYALPGSLLPAPEFGFRDYVLGERAAREAPPYERAREYWLARLDELPAAPDLPLAVNPASIAQPRFMRRTAGLDAAATARLRAQAAAHGVTLSALLLGVYGDVLAAWSSSPRLTINIPLFNRQPLHPEVQQVVGAFTSVELLAVDASAGPTFAERARRVQAQLLDDLDHRLFDGVAVMRELARRGGAAAMPVVFTSLVDVAFSDALAQLGSVHDSLNQTAQVWMDLHADEHDGALLLKWDAVEGLFPAGMVEAMLAAYRDALQALADGDAAWDATDFEALPAEQRARRAAANDTVAPQPAGLLQELLRAQAEARPDAPAVIAAGRTLSFGELWQRSQQVGRTLRERGARPNELVAIVLEKGWEQAVAAYGVLSSGAAYLPIDPEFPEERRRLLLEHGGVQLVLTQSRLDAQLAWPDGVQRLCVDDDATWAGVDATALEPVQRAEDLAYVLYTSGSTGVPKGVMIEHRSVLNRMLDVNARFGVGPGDHALALTALHHDLSVYDLFGVIGAGGALVVPAAESRRDPARWQELVRTHGVTLWNSVPAFMEMFVEYLEHAATRPGAAPAGLETLRLAILSGDWVPVTLPDRLRALAPQVQVVSAGGPTETTVWDICYPVGTVDPGWTSIPYGRPMTNARYYVLDEAWRERPEWVTGELYIGGTGLARGYWRDEERTRAAFVTHPRSGERLYRSGDTGRFRPDGLIEFMGRADFQVKIQGQRIELGEIEAALLQLPAVRGAVVAAVGERARRRLVGYVVPANGALDEATLRDALGARLPAHMVPQAFVTLERLPLTANGKVDRRSLPDPAEPTSTTNAAPAARSANVARVAAIVGSVLGVSEPEAEANLLSLGASSIDMVRIGNQLEQQLGARPRMDELFRLQTIAALAGWFDARESDSQGGGVAAHTGQPPLGGSAIDQLIASYRVLSDPAEIDALKAQQLGVRRDPARARVALPGTRTGELAARYTRHSSRRFQLAPIALAQFGALLECLRQLECDGKARYRYASAGGAYPLQAYLHVQPGRVEGLDGGTYYYHPVEHALVSLTPGAVIDRSIHVPFVNQPTFDEAAFSILLVAELDAIAPTYGAHTPRFIQIEAGGMAHALELAAVESGLGLCQIGSIQFERIRPLFDLTDHHVLVHSLLGGLPVAATAAAPQAPAGDARVASLLDRVKDLSPEQVRALLAANRASAGPPA